MASPAKPYVVKVPDIGEGIAEVELVAWHVQVGDLVADEQVLADVMTDKATVEVPAPIAGRVLALGGEVGQMLAVGGELVRIEREGAAPGAAASASAASAAVEAASVPASAAAPFAAPAKTAAAGAAATGAVDAVSASASAASKHGTAERTPATPALVPASRAATAAGARPIASPSVRARAWELGIDLAEVRASGTAGRVMQADLDTHVARGGSVALKGPATQARPARANAPAAARASAAAADATETIKVVGLRRKIAEKMQLAKRRIPHYAYVEEIDVTELEALRGGLNERWGAERGRLTLLPFLIRALIVAAQDFPQVNARFDDETGVLTRYRAVHMGVAAQTDAGLMVPVLRDAQDLDLWQCAAEVARLAEAARSGKVVREELSGSTITITSLGRLGGIASTPVINHPEVAIVGVNRMVERPMIRGGAIVPRLMMNLSSSFDHRVVDGAVGAGFIQRVREMLEQPGMLFVE